MSEKLKPCPFYIYRWDRQGRKGQPCDVLIRTKVMNSCLVKFEDGYTMVTSGSSIKDIAEVTGHSEKDAETIIRKHYLVSSAAVERIESRTRSVNQSE